MNTPTKLGTALTPSRWLVAILTAGMLMSLYTPMASSQDADLRIFQPASPRTSSYWTTYGTRAMRGGEFELALMAEYANDPLVLNDQSGDRIGSIVEHLVTGHMLLNVGIARFLDVSVDLPLIFMQDGDDAVFPALAAASSAGFGVGDIRVTPRLSIIRAPLSGEGVGGFGLSLFADVYIPTGDDTELQGSDFRVRPAVALEFVTAAGPSIAANFGVLFQQETLIANAAIGRLFTYSVAAAVPVVDWLDILVDVYGGVVITGETINTEELPLEIMAGGRFGGPDGIFGEVGFGVGLIEGFGVPDYRVLATLGYARRLPDDRDGDGINDSEDECPNDPEDFDGFEDNDGCPDTDNDGDGIADIDDGPTDATGFGRCRDQAEDFDGFEDDDGCPDNDNDGDGIADIDDGPRDQSGFGSCRNEPEDFDGFEDDDGCPDSDNDGDGIADIDDGPRDQSGFGSCRNDPEDFDGFEDDDGCPDSDNDGDGIADLNDGPSDESGFGACRNDPEDFDGFEDNNGCPEEGEGEVRLTCEEIEILDRVYFEFDRAVIQPRSYDLLAQVAGIILSNSYLDLVSIDGHTDSIGSDAYNADLSTRRAAAVVQYLIEEHGVPAARLRSAGYGESVPIATNDTARGRAINRRVEFRILEYSGGNCPQFEEGSGDAPTSGDEAAGAQGEDPQSRLEDRDASSQPRVPIYRAEPPLRRELGSNGQENSALERYRVRDEPAVGDPLASERELSAAGRENGRAYDVPAVGDPYEGRAPR